ncbi:MAG: hypothetical protein R2682_14400 [Pyrinomonadaceae bacterium]
MSSAEFSPTQYQGLQVFEIKQHSVVIGVLERDREDAFLRVVQVEQISAAAVPFPRPSHAAASLPVCQKHPIA